MISPNLPGFNKEMPQTTRYTYTYTYTYTYDALAATVLAFIKYATEMYTLQVFNYGAPTGFRLATAD